MVQKARPGREIGAFVVLGMVMMVSAEIASAVAILEIVFARGVRRERYANTRAQPGTFPGTLRRVSRVFAVI